MLNIYEAALQRKTMETHTHQHINTDPLQIVQNSGHRWGAGGLHKGHRWDDDALGDNKKGGQGMDATSARNFVVCLKQVGSPAVC